MKLIETQNEHSINIEIVTGEGSQNITFTDDEPEENTFSKNLDEVYYISDLIIMAYYAGKFDEEFNFKFIDERKS